MARLALENLLKTFGKTAAVDGLSLDIPHGAFVSILGPSGCGKTTLLRLVAGLERPTRGRILVDGQDITVLPPERRGLGMMFQSYALFPHMTVHDNLLFPLKMRRLGSREEQEEKIARALSLVRMAGMEERLPRQLSGGQQQRVALARAIISEPSVLLLDEPLSNLDARLREEMQVELIELHRQLALTTLFVTHNQEEALSLSDIIVLMSRGQIQQIGTPTEIYAQPTTPFVADFIGAANLIAVRVFKTSTEHWQAELPGGARVRVRPPRDGQAGEYTLMLRQEDLVLTRDPGRFEAAVPVQVLTRVYLGSKVRFVVNMG